MYKNIINDYLTGQNDVAQFVRRFMDQWRTDRDAGTRKDPIFQRLLDRIFTSCDCYSDQPESEFEIDGQTLKQEVSLLSHIWYG